MKAFAILCFVFATIVAQVHATIESMGDMTVEDARGRLSDSDYKLNLEDGTKFMDDGWKATLLDLKKSPALGLKDVQFQFADGTIYPGQAFVRHFHPRSSELIQMRNGKMEVDIEFETGKIVTNTLRKEDLLVIPEGLIHVARCLSKRKCYFIAVFRTADPGFVPLPPRSS